jgi:transposase
VWPTFRQTTEEVIKGFETAWLFFGGIFPVVIPDNMSSIVTKAENTAPRFNDTFFEYSQARGFSIDPARVATPTDKPRVERVVPYVRNNFFAGESFVDLTDCRDRAETCASTARPSAGPPRSSYSPS